MTFCAHFSYRLLDVERMNLSRYGSRKSPSPLPHPTRELEEYLTDNGSGAAIFLLAFVR